MGTLKRLSDRNAIESTESDHIIRVLLASFMVRDEYKNVSILNKKDEIISDFSSLLEKYLKLRLATSSTEKLRVINFIDKLNQQRELLDLEKERLNINDVKIASERLGKKAQSGFETK